MAVFVSLFIIASWMLYADAGDPGISILPSRDQTVAITSNENVTYECVVDGGRSVFWRVQNNPLEGDHISQFESIGIYKQDSPLENSSILIVSRMGRETYRNTGQNVKIQCRAFTVSPPMSGFSDVLCIISYGPPETPGNLLLIATDGNITLSWSRPLNIPQSVSVSYLVEVNSTTRSNVTYEPVTTSGTSVVIQEDAAGLEGCETFEFFVTASNEAGDSNPARIEETIPISPDVSSISSSLSIDSVQRVNQSVSVAVSFKPANTCSENFPITNYSVNLVGFRRITFDSRMFSSRGQISFLLNSSQVNELVPDSRYTISVTACIEITCRESEAKQVYTTDVQNATVTFFGTRVFLTCTFANRSSARGCIVRFTLSNNRTEQFNITQTEAQLCGMTANQMTAYDRVEVVDWEADGNEGILPIRVQPLEAVDEQSFTMSCPGESSLSGGAVAAAVLGVFLAFGFVITTVTVIIIFWKTHKIPHVAEAPSPVFLHEKDSFTVTLPDVTEEEAGLSAVVEPSGDLGRHPVPPVELKEVNLENLEEAEDNVFTPLLSLQPSATLIVDESDPTKNMKLKVSRKCIRDAIAHARRKLSEGAETQMKSGRAPACRSVSLSLYSQVVPIARPSVPDPIKEVNEELQRSSSSPVP